MDFQMHACLVLSTRTEHSKSILRFLILTYCFIVLFQRSTVSDRRRAQVRCDQRQRSETGPDQRDSRRRYLSDQVWWSAARRRYTAAEQWLEGKHRHHLPLIISGMPRSALFCDIFYGPVPVSNRDFKYVV